MRSGQLVCGDLPNDQEALVERNGCKVEHRGEDGLPGEGGDVTESRHSPLPHNAMCPVQAFCSPHNPRKSQLSPSSPRTGKGTETREGPGAGPRTHSSFMTGQKERVSTDSFGLLAEDHAL